MKSSREKVSVKYIYELPYPERKELHQLLDAERKWEDLGGLYIKIDPVKLTLIGNAVCRGDSPTCQVLEVFGQRNGTVDELFCMLNKMKHFRAMKIILKYVNPNYHHLLQDAGLDFSTILLDNHSKLSSAQPSAPNQQLLTQQSQHNDSAMGAAAAKFQTDPSNFNGPVSNQSMLPSKFLSPQNCASNNPPSTTHKLSSESKTYNVSQATGLNDPTDKKGICSDMKKLNIPIARVANAEIPSKKNQKPSEGAFSSFVTDDLPLVMKLSHKEILKSTDNFDEDRILGTGGFGIVYKGYWKGIPVAIKRLVPKNRAEAGNQLEVQNNSLKQSYNELKILNKCRIDNILPLYGFSFDGPEPCIVYQYMSNGSLEDRLLCKSNTAPLTWLQRSVIADGTAKGLNYLHTLPEKPLVHGDIKSANILLDSDMKAKIGDFGLAREGPTSQYTHLKVSSIHGTKVYLPPEYLRNSQLSPKVDVYCFGILLLEVSTGQRALNERRTKNKLLSDYVTDMEEAGQLESLKDPKAGREGEEWFDEIIKIGIKCSLKNKNRRPDMSEVLKQFERSQTTIDTAARMRRQSKEMVQFPPRPQMSPMELQIWYDIHNGPAFPAQPLHQACYGGLEPLHFPNYNQAPPNISPPPTYSSFHASQIREPPSQLIEDPRNSLPPVYQESSCAATAGSSNYGVETSIPEAARSQENGTDNNSSDSILPFLTILGTKPAGDNAGTDDLGPTPHPSGVLSGVQLKTDESNVVVTPSLGVSGLSLGGSDSEDSEENS